MRDDKEEDVVGTKETLGDERVGGSQESHQGDGNRECKG